MEVIAMSKKIFSVSVPVVAVLLVLAAVGVWLSGNPDGNYLIAKDGAYVICDGERYVPAGDGFFADTPTDEIIAERVPVEGGDFLDNNFIYGYIIYGSETDDSVIYVHTAESHNNHSGYYVKDTAKTTE